MAQHIWGAIKSLVQLVHKRKDGGGERQSKNGKLENLKRLDHEGAFTFIEESDWLEAGEKYVFWKDIFRNNMIFLFFFRA